MDKKQYDHRQGEAEMQQFWQEQKIYDYKMTDKLFSIDTPPPTVFGSLHVEHVFFYISIFLC